MYKLVRRFFKNDSGATAIKYAVSAAGISMGIIAAVQSLGTTLKGTFNGVANAL
jgi:pilus assembly protein Flp/PilA